MVVDALRAYVQLASGLTEVTVERAKTAARALVTQAGSLSEAPAESAAQVRTMADELMKTARDNRDVVLGVVRTEVERAVAAMGVVQLDDFAALQKRLAAVEERLFGGAPAEPDPTPAPSDSVVPTESAVGETDADADAGDTAADGDIAAGTAEDDTAAAAADREDTAVESADDGAMAGGAADGDLDIPTPVAVERLVAKKRAAEREWDEDAWNDAAAAGSSADEAAQDPSPPDVSTT